MHDVSGPGLFSAGCMAGIDGALVRCAAAAQREECRANKGSNYMRVWYGEHLLMCDR